MSLFKMPIDLILYMITSILGVLIGSYKIASDNGLEYKGIKPTEGFKDTMNAMSEMESSFKDAYNETYYEEEEEVCPQPKPKPKPRAKPKPRPRKTPVK